MRVLLLLALSLVAASAVSALNNGLARTPPMGYNTWFDFGCSTQMNEANVLASAQSLVSTGLAALGYTFVNLDDCWASQSRNPQTHQQEASESFSSGIASLATQVHGLGLQLGLLTDRGELTCNGRAGSLGFESLDAECYAGWGVDFVQEAGCNATDDHNDAIAQYASMRDALNATGRDMFFAINEGQAWYAPQAAAIANAWRTGPSPSTPPISVLSDGSDDAEETDTDAIIEPAEDDSTDSSTPWEAILANIDAMAVGALGSYAGPGGFNDPGLLLSADHTGRLLISENQTRAQMGQWAVMASPLLISGSLSLLSSYNLETYSNAEVIRINQDVLGTQGVLVYTTSEGSLQQGASQIWAKQLVDGSFALHFLNAHPNETRSLRCDAQCFAQAGASLDIGWGIKVRDVWAQKDLLFTDAMDYTVSSLIPAGGSALMQFTWQPLSEEAQPGPMTPGDPHSVIKLDPTIQPRNYSTIPGWGKWVEQCGEFVFRYFNTLGLHYPTMGQPYYFLMTGLDANNQSHPAFERVLNNGTLPPKAGDILVAKGPADGEFHTALIQAVRGSSITIFQANVAWDWAAPGKFLYARLPLQYDLTTSRYFMPDLPTSQFGYNHDFPVAGWIHPTGAANAIPGTPP